MSWEPPEAAAPKEWEPPEASAWSPPEASAGSSPRDFWETNPAPAPSESLPETGDGSGRTSPLELITRPAGSGATEADYPIDSLGRLTALRVAKARQNDYKQPSFWDTLMDPTVSVVDRMGPEQAGNIARATDPTGMLNALSPAGVNRTAAILQNVSSDTVNFFTSPAGVLTLGIGALPKAAQSAFAAVFAANAAHEVPTQLHDIVTAKTPEERDEAIKGFIEQAAVLGGTSGHLLERGRAANAAFSDAKKTVANASTESLEAMAIDPDFRNSSPYDPKLIDDEIARRKVTLGENPSTDGSAESQTSTNPAPDWVPPEATEKAATPASQDQEAPAETPQSQTEPAKSNALADDAAKETIPQLRSGETQGDLLSKQTEDLKLVGETGADTVKSAEDKAIADKAKADAKSKRDQQQRDMFNEGLQKEQADTLSQFSEDMGASNYELLESVKSLGGLPALSDEAGKAASGEIARILEAHPNMKAKAVQMGLTRKGAPDLDTLREALNERGFEFDTPHDMLDAIERRITTGREMFGTKGKSPGPGAASAAEDIANPLPSTGLKRAVVDTERLSRGAEPIPTVERQREADVVRAVEDVVDADPTAVPALVSQIVDHGLRSIDEREAAALLVERRRVMNERAAWEERLGRGEDVDTARSKLAELETQLDRLDQAQRTAGSTWGRLGHMYQRMIADDYTLDAMERTAIAAKAKNGEPMTRAQFKEQFPEEHAKLQEQAKRIAELEKDADQKRSEFHTSALDAQAKATYEATIEDLKKQNAKSQYGKEVFDIARKIVDRWKEEAKSAHDDLRKALGAANAGIPNPAIVLHVAKILRAKIGEFGLDKTEAFAEMVSEYGPKVQDHLENGWSKMKQLIAGEKGDSRAKEVAQKGVNKRGDKTPMEAAAAAKAEAVAGEPLSHKVVFDYVKSLIQSGVHGVDPLMKAAHEGLKEHFPDLTERDVRRAYGEYGKVKFPSKEATARELSETRRIVQLQESIDRLNEGQDPLHTGLQRDKATQQIREKQKELNELLKKHAGPPSPEKLASRDQAKQTALRNAIEDLDKQLRTGEKPVKGAPAADSPAVEQLKAERDAMKAKLQEIEEAANPGKTAAEKQVDQLSNIRKRLDEQLSGKRPENAPKDWTPLSGEAETLKAEIQAMQELKAQMKRDAKPAGDPNAAKEKAQIAAFERAIDKLNERLKNKNFTPDGRWQGPLSKKAAAVKAVLDARRDAYKAAREAGKPVRTPEQRFNETRLKQVEKRTKELEALRDSGRRSAAKVGPAAPQMAKYKEVIAAEAKAEKVKDEVRTMLEKERLANRTPSQKFWDHFVGIERAMKLSSDVVLAKLSTAALVREGLLTPAEEVVGGGISKLLPELAKRAPREGGLNLKAEAKAKAAAFTSGMKDAWDNIRFRKSELENRFGSKKPDNPSWYEYFGYLHGALKAPVKRAEFARSLEKRIYSARQAGVDVNNIETMGRLAQESYVDAERAIFMQDNAIAEFFNKGLSVAEQSKKFPNGGAAIARIGRFLVPIVKVPTNIVGEVATGVHGVTSGGVRAAMAYVKGIESLPPEQADAIMRQLKKGLIGNALLLTGYLGYKSIGGFYQSRENRDESDVAADHFRIGSIDLPQFTSHSTAAMLLNIGATFRRVDEKKGVGSATFDAGMGELKQLPFVPAMTRAVEAMQSDEGFHKYVRDMAIGSTIPAIVTHAAKVIDTPGTFPANALTPSNKRYPSNDVDAVKMQIPGLRQQVPQDRQKPHREPSHKRR